MTATAEKTDYSFLPKGVAKQAEAADETLAAIAGGKTGDPKPDDQAGDGSKSVQSDPVKKPDTQPPAASSDSENWKQKYDVLNGKYNAEVPRMAAEIRSLKQAVQQLTDENTVLKSQKPKVEPKPWKTDEISAEDLDIMEPEVRAVFEDNKRLRDAVTQLQDQIKGLSKDIGATKQETGLATLYSRLDSDPRSSGWWRRQNLDKDFSDNWLMTTDPISGILYRDLLLNARDNGDIDRIIGIFKEYQKQTGKSYSDPASSSTDNPRVPAPTVAPPRSRSGGEPNKAPETKIYTRKEVDQFYQDLARGKFFGREDEASRTEKDIMKAVRENRVR